MRPAAFGLLILLMCGVARAQDTPEGLVANPGFEAAGTGVLPAGWSGDTGVYQRVTAPVHSGQAALAFTNNDPASYRLCSQTVHLQAGRRYELSAWVKTEDIVGVDTGATICLEYYGPEGKYLGGNYPAGIRGASDWRQVKGISGRVPDEAVRCQITCYVRQGMTGKAWFDDVVVKPWLEPAGLRTMLVRPNYRGVVTRHDPTIEFSVAISVGDTGLDLRIAPVEAAVLPVGSTDVVRTRTVRPGNGGRYAMSLKGLRPGPYVLRLRLPGEGGEVLAEETWRLQVVDQAPQRRSFIDERNVLQVQAAEGDYEPFFPLGMYWSSINAAQLATYADSSFNCLMPYGSPTREQLDLAQQHGLKVIYSVKDAYYGSTWAPAELKSEADERPYIEGKVQQFRDHPALLAWYLNDELPLDYRQRLEAHQQWLEELDPDHPTWVVLWQVDQVNQYARTFDAIGTDPYPIPDQSASRAGNYAARTVAAVDDARPVWMVPQVFNWATYRSRPEDKAAARPPTLAEMQSMAWQCLVHGAKGLIFYSYFDLISDTDYPFDQQWPKVKQLAAGIAPWTNCLLTGDSDTAISVRPHDWLHWTTRSVGNVTYLFMVNDEPRAHAAVFTLPRLPVACHFEGLAESEALGVSRSLRVPLTPHEVRIYRLTF